MASRAARWQVSYPIGVDGTEPCRRLVGPARTSGAAGAGPTTCRTPCCRAPAGSVVSANQNAARTNRLVEALGGTHLHTAEDFERLQHDTTAWSAGQLVPLLAPLRAVRNDVEAARLRLLQWDRRVSADSTAAALYVFWEEALGRLLSEKRLGPDLVNDYLGRAGLSVIPLAAADAGMVRRQSRPRA